MKVRLRTEQKAGLAAEENEDAAATSPAGRWPFWAALADGATESAFSRSWAAHLVSAFVEDGGATREAVGRWREAWAARHGVPRGPWYLEAKAVEGSHATLLGLGLDRRGTWRAWCVGDGLLFYGRAAPGFSHWPEVSHADFTDRPHLISTQPTDPVPAIAQIEGRWQPGDVFLLTTDALGKYLLSTEGPDIGRLLGGDFSAWVARARRDGLANDDTTALVVEVRSET